MLIVICCNCFVNMCFVVTGADSLAYLSVEGLKLAVRENIDNKDNSTIGHCTACLTGEYPSELDW